MNVAGFLLIDLLLLCVAAESQGSLTGLQHTLTKRQEGSSNNCTDEELYTFLDPTCWDNYDVIVNFSRQLRNSSSDLGQQSDQLAIDELNRALEGVCTETCGGILYTIFTECISDGDAIANVIANLCSSNGDILCRLMLNSQVSFTATHCSNLSLDTSICPPGCKEALNTVIDVIGCCSNNNLQLYLYIFNETVEDFYSTCEVQDPGFCPITFQSIIELDEVDGATGTMTATVELLLVAIMCAAFSKLIS